MGPSGNLYVLVEKGALPAGGDFTCLQSHPGAVAQLLSMVDLFDSSSHLVVAVASAGWASA